MLVLTRHVHQSIVIGHDVVVTVLEVRGDQVRLGITAPKDVQVHREEVFAALTAANRQAATSAAELQVLSELADAPRGEAAAAPGVSQRASGPPRPRPASAPPLDRRPRAGGQTASAAGRNDAAPAGAATASHLAGLDGAAQRATEAD